MTPKSNLDIRPPFPPRDCVSSARMPAHERVVDRLADLLFDADEILEMLDAEDARTLRSITPRIRAVYEEIDSIMKTLVD
jgi:hypothetical protein